MLNLKEQNKQINFSCNPVLKNALKRTAKKMNTSQSEVIKLALSQFLSEAIKYELKKENE